MNEPRLIEPRLIEPRSSDRRETYVGLICDSPTVRRVPEVPDWQLSVTVHRATGMVAVQLGCDVDEALLRMKVLADATDETLEHIARSIVDRAITLEP